MNLLLARVVLHNFKNENVRFYPKARLTATYKIFIKIVLINITQKEERFLIEQYYSISNANDYIHDNCIFKQ